MTLMTQAAWARSQGFSRQYVQKLIKTGRIQLVDGMIDTAAANHMLIQSRDHDRPERRNSSLPDDALSELLKKTKIKKEMECVKALEMKNKAKSGEWVSAEDVKATAFKVGREVRDGLLNIPDRIADQLAVMHDAHAIYRLLHQEIRCIIEALITDD